MTNSMENFLSRRKWLGLAATASVGSGLLAATRAMGQSAPTSSGDLGRRTHNIRDFGAKGDGGTVETAAVQASFGACTKDQGGTVLVTAGIFVIGSVALMSAVML